MQFWCRIRPAPPSTSGEAVWFHKPLTMRQVAGKPIFRGQNGVARTGHIGSQGSISRLTRCVVVERHITTHSWLSGRLGDGLVHQQDRNTVANRERSATLAALQGPSFILQD